MGKFMIIFHTKLQLNKWDFPLNFYLQELFLHLAEKTLKMYLPSTPIVNL